MDYAVTCMAGLVFIYGYNIVSAILRGMGDSRRPFYFVAIAAVLNIIVRISKIQRSFFIVSGPPFLIHCRFSPGSCYYPRYP